MRGAFRMKSFALWCDARNANDSARIRVLMNFNLWVESEKKKSKTFLDVGVMLLPSAADSMEQESVGDVVKSISFYCPFLLEEKDFEDLFSKMDEKTVGAIFNDRCECTKPDSRPVNLITLHNGDPCRRFLLCKCEPGTKTVQLIKSDSGKGTIIKILIDSNVGASPVYYRFRLSGDFISSLVAVSHSKDKLLTSAFAQEEVIDFRFNDYRTLDDDRVSENIDEKAQGCVPIEGMAVHFLLMSLATVDVDSGCPGGKGRRLLEKDIWNNYAPCEDELDDVAAWHWSKQLKRASDGYKVDLRLRRHICNWKTIMLYIFWLFVIDFVFNLIENPFFNWLGSLFPRS